MEDNPLDSKGTNLNVSIFKCQYLPKDTVSETSKITFNHISGRDISAKSTHKMNHHRYAMKTDGKNKNEKAKS